MPCYSPLQAFRSILVKKDKPRFLSHMSSNKFYSLVKDQPHYVSDGCEYLYLPCGQCIGCRLERSRQWAIRCVHEASLYSDNCFITLTFDDEHLPADLSLDVRTWQLFMKRLRKRFGDGIRFFHCGEYGDLYGRPHYHACLFNFDFPDKKLFKLSNGLPLYTSESLSELWPYGFSTIGDLTFESAAYVARYVMKKVTGDRALSHYKGRKCEYTTMSRRPGIGSGWFAKFANDVYPSDFVVMRGRKMKPPRYYDTILEQDSVEMHSFIKMMREVESEKHFSELSPDRLRVRKVVKLSQINKLKRPLDEERLAYVN